MLNCLRYLGMHDMTVIKRMTLVEYHLRMEAYLLQKVDREYELHLQAWLNNQVKAEKKSGKSSKPVFKQFDDFFDYEERIAEVQGKKKESIIKDSTLSSLLRKANA